MSSHKKENIKPYIFQMRSHIYIFLLFVLINGFSNGPLSNIIQQVHFIRVLWTVMRLYHTVVLMVILSLCSHCWLYDSYALPTKFP